MQSRFYRVLAAFAAVSLMTVTSVHAVPYSVTTVGGVWSSASPGTAASGVGTSHIQWGEPALLFGWKSGYLFEGAAPPVISGNIGDTFEIGTFTHQNYPITGDSITSATLDVTLDLTIDGVFFDDVLFSFGLEHEETLNNGPNPDDIVSFVNPSQEQSLTVNGQAYLLQLLGFEVNGSLVSEFMTREKKSNLAKLVAVITPTSVVPEPTTYLSLGSFLVLACLVQRRKKTSVSGM